MTTERVVAAIWDLDGLMVDTESVFDEVFQDYAVARTGKRMPEAEFRAMRARMFGGKAIESARILHEALGLSDPPEEHLRWREAYDLAALFRERAAVLPGVRTVLAALQRRGVPQALATSSSRDLLEAKLARQAWLRSFFGEAVVTGDDVSRGKPDPELFVRAAALLRVSSDRFGRVLVFEDAPNGVMAAKAVGMKVVAVPHPHLDRRLVAQADQVLDSLEQFDAAAWGVTAG